MDRTGDRFLTRWLNANYFTLDISSSVMALLLGTIDSLRSNGFAYLLHRTLTIHNWTCQSRKLADEILRIVSFYFDKSRSFEIKDHEFPDGEHDINFIYNTPTETCLITILHIIFRDFGSKPFRMVADQSFYCALFPFLAERLSKHSSKYRDRTKFHDLYYQFANLSPGAKARYIFLLLNPWDIFARLDDMGCKYGQCEERIQVKGMMQKCKDLENLNDPNIDKGLTLWRLKLKACGRCQLVAYCSRECQKADWARHQETECVVLDPISQSLRVNELVNDTRLQSLGLLSERKLS